MHGRAHKTATLISIYHTVPPSPDNAVALCHAAHAAQLRTTAVYRVCCVQQVHACFTN